MRRTKRQVQKDLKLARLPDDAFMHLLTEGSDSDIVGGPSLEGARVYSPEESQAVVEEAATHYRAGGLSKPRSKPIVAQTYDAIGQE